MSDTTSVYQAYQGNTYLFGGNAPYVEEMYENYLANPGSVPDTWREYFDALQHVPAVDGSNAKDVPHLPVINAFAERAKQGGTKVVVATGADSELGRKRGPLGHFSQQFAVQWGKKNGEDDAPETAP